MKNQVLFAVLAVLAVYVTAAVVDPVAKVVPELIVEPEVEAEPASAQNRNLNVGNVNVGDRLLYRNYYIKYPLANAIQTQDITYRGNGTTRVTAVQANEVGYTQYASAFIVGGALNTTTITIRLSTARGYGYYFLVDFYGR